MNLNPKNFSRTELTKEFKEFGGEYHRRNVIRYSYESENKLIDIETFLPVPFSFGMVGKIYRVNGRSSQTPTDKIHKEIEKYFNLF